MPETKSNGIEGVIVKPVIRYCDDRGHFAEIARFDELISIPIKQSSFTKTYPDVTKAFHYHCRQIDVWFPEDGNLRVVLYDLREYSPTAGKTQEIYAGEDNPCVIVIPMLVAHGYQVLGGKPAKLVYFTTKVYDPSNPDEERIPYNDPKIGFDWTIKNR